jgi:hypothetical protein
MSFLFACLSVTKRPCFSLCSAKIRLTMHCASQAGLSLEPRAKGCFGRPSNVVNLYARAPDCCMTPQPLPPQRLSSVNAMSVLDKKLCSWPACELSATKQLVLCQGMPLLRNGNSKHVVLMNDDLGSIVCWLHQTCPVDAWQHDMQRLMYCPGMSS